MAGYFDEILEQILDTADLSAVATSTPSPTSQETTPVVTPEHLDEEPVGEDTAVSDAYDDHAADR